MKKETWGSIRLYLIIIGLIIFIVWLMTCKKPISTPTYVPIKNEKVVYKADSIAIKHINDSFLVVLKQKDAKIKDDEFQFSHLMADYLTIQDDIGTTLSEPIPDTCKGIVTSLTGQFNKLKQSSAQTIKAGENVVTSLKSKIATQTQFLAAKDTALGKKDKLIKVCFEQQGILEKYVKKIKPKNEINVGIEAMSSYLELKPAVGLAVGYRGKTGYQVNLAYFSNQVVSIGIKKTLFKF